MQYIGLLTDVQKRAGYFVTQDEDFISLWHRRNGKPACIAIFLYETARIKEVRDKVEGDSRLQIVAEARREEQI